MTQDFTEANLKMKSTINGFSQKALIDRGLNAHDALLLDWIYQAIDSNEFKSVNRNGFDFYFISYERVLDALPILKINTKKGIRKKFIELKNKGALEKASFSDQEAYEKLKAGPFDSGCHFCGYNTTFLDKHHFPVRASKGGTETIDLCANCHREFHHIADYGLFRVTGLQD
jgi:hypothetical protein